MTHSIDYDEIALLRIAHQTISVRLEQSQHLFAVNQVLGTPQANEGILPFARSEESEAPEVGRSR